MVRIIWIILLSCCVITAPGQGKRNKRKKQLILFQLNDRQITADEFIYLYNKNHQSKPNEYSADDINEYLDLFVKFKLKVEEARQRRMDTTASFIAEYNSYRNELIKPYLPDNKVMDSLLNQAYERLKEEVRVSHILIGVKEDASPADSAKAYKRAIEIKQRILNGEDFGSLAVEYSEDPSAKVNKGDLGFFTALQMIYPFETASYSTPVGGLAGPVRTKFGYHLIKVTDRQPARGEVEVSHIMVRTANDKDDEKSKNIIFNVYDQLMAGASWDELCRQYSDDKSSKDNGGRLRPFGVGVMASVPEFEKTAFSLQPGQISDPFRTAYGWHILRVENRIPLPAFDDMKDQLRKRIARDDRFLDSRNLLMAKLKQKNDFQENSEIKVAVIKTADSALVKGTWKSDVVAGLESQTLFSLNGNSTDVRSFANYIMKHQQPSNKDQPEKVMSKLYEDFVQEKIIDLAGMQIVKQIPEFEMLANEYYEGILLFDIMEKEVWNKASEDTAGQMKYYYKNKTRYLAGERMKATFYSAPDSMTLKPLFGLALKNDSTGTMNYAERKRIKVETGIFEKDDKAILSTIDWSLGVHSAENNGIYYLAWIHQILPSGEKSFGEARAAIVADYQKDLEETWIRQLQKKYPLRINEKGKHYVLDQLQKR
jgi:peptidyl-prolyl cis-trans isomerase SurA